jgi:hypothetical protein
VEGRLKSTILTTGPCHYPGKYIYLDSDKALCTNYQTGNGGCTDLVEH